MKKTQTTINCRTAKNNGSRSGAALLLTLVVLVVLSSVVYKLVSEITSLEHRQQYLIDYQKAQYACDSGMKYALSRAEKISMSLPAREDYPELWDFSDTYWMDEEVYEDTLRQWAQFSKNGGEYSADSDSGLAVPDDVNSPGLTKIFEDLVASAEAQQEAELSESYVPGPYLVEWPNVIAPIEYEVDGVKVTIAIEDENAKLPLIWATQSGNDETEQAAADSLITVVSTWMGMDDDSVSALFEQLEQISSYKQFRLSYPTVTVTETVKPTTSNSSKSRRTTTRKSAAKRTVKKQRPDEEHARDFAKLIFSSIIDLESLATPVIDTEARKEAPIKYLGLWGSDKVNINTAPRHVLEGTFAFGGKAVEIADEIIRLRREQPFKNITDLKERMYGYNDSIQEVASYIIFKSEYLSIKITAQSGKAKSVMMAGVLKQKKEVKKVATFSY